MKTSIGPCMDIIHSVEKTHSESLKTRAATLQRNYKHRRPVTRSQTKQADESPENIEKKRILIRQSDERIHKSRKTLEKCERDVQVMVDKKADPKLNGHRL